MWGFRRDRLGRFRCHNCGLCASVMRMEYPDEPDEDHVVCMTCFKSGYEAWMPLEIAEAEFPDWNKRWRDHLKADRARRKEMIKTRETN